MPLKRALIALFVVITQSVYGKIEQHPWSSHNIKGGLGSYAVFDESRLGPVFHLGYEFGQFFGNQQQYYLAIDAMSSAFIPDTFEEKSITLFGKSYSVKSPWQLLIPVVHFYAGYRLNQKQIIMIGSTYIWGLTLATRSIIEKSPYFWEVSVVFFLDRVFFDSGIHDGYATLNLGINL